MAARNAFEHSSCDLKGERLGENICCKWSSAGADYTGENAILVTSLNISMTLDITRHALYILKLEKNFSKKDPSEYYITDFVSQMFNTRLHVNFVKTDKLQILCFGDNWDNWHFFSAFNVQSWSDLKGHICPRVA